MDTGRQGNVLSTCLLVYLFTFLFMTQKYSAKQSVTINAPSFKVWHALVTPEIIKHYFFGVETITDWREGSPIIFRGDWEGKPFEDKGKILKFEPEKLLATTYWSAFFGLPDSPENYQRVVYELSPEGKQTVLTITQDDIRTEESRDHTAKNWEMVLNALKNLLEK